MNDGSDNNRPSVFIYVFIRVVILSAGLAFLLWGPLNWGLRMAIFVTFFMAYAGVRAEPALGKWM